MKRTTAHVLAFIIVAFITYNSFPNPLQEDYRVLFNDSAIEVVKKQDALYGEIEKKANLYEKAPQDAKIDKVWKAMPGLNGKKVNIEKSYTNMKKDGLFNEKKLIFDEIPPTVHLEDLPASPIYRGHPDKKMVSFIINVAWGNEYIPDMLETLEKNNVRATFFLEGRWVKENPSLAKMIFDAGHELGNHSYTHPDMKTLGSNAVRDQLIKTNDVINATTGVKPTWFGPPSGSYRQEVVEIAKELNMGTIMWSVDTIDWQRPEPHVIVNRVTEKVHPGALILMHPTEPTAKALETMIISIKEKDLEIDTVSSLLSEERRD